MLAKLHLTNFQRHRDLTVDFSGGLQVIRANSEGGKSTLIRAACYALFGAKSLPASLDDIVTHGEPVASLRVELDILVDGESYSIVRGKSGAECNTGSVRVTGQTEVTNFMSKVLGVDAAGAARLILANQNDIRGALESGPRATADLIEKLAEFDQLDKLVDLVQTELPTGSAVAEEAGLLDAQDRLASLKAGVQADFAGLERTVALQTATGLELEALLASRQAAHTRAAAQLATAEQTNKAVDRVEADAARCWGDLTTLGMELQALIPSRLPGDLAGVRIDLEKARAVSALGPVYTKFNQALLASAGEEFEGDIAQLQAEIKQAVSAERAAAVKAADARRNREVKQALKIVGSCTLCGKDVSEVAEVVAKNAQLDADIESLKALETRELARATEMQEYAAACQEVLARAQPLYRLANEYPAQIVFPGGTVPPRATWVGTADFEHVAREFSALSLLESNILQVQRSNDQVSARKQALTEQLARLEVTREQLLVESRKLTRVDLTKVEAASRAALVLVEETKGSARSARDALSAATQALNDARAEARNQADQIQVWTEQVSKREQSLKQLQFNNELLKKIRVERPKITDKLWSLVLGAVSSYFSTMRGENSLVTKSADGFKVDGHTVATLSGSTLDILGLAVRVALVKTFLPMAEFIVLDEPSAAMDSQRTINMLGFLAASGFKQTLLVTHEDISGDFADNIITL